MGPKNLPCVPLQTCCPGSAAVLGAVLPHLPPEACPLSTPTLDSTPLIFRKQKYFYKGGLVWDENSSDGRYVKENCKPLKVSFWLPPAQLMPRRDPRHWADITAETGQATKGCLPDPALWEAAPKTAGCWQWGFLHTVPEGPLALPLPHRVAMNVIGEHRKSQMPETLLLPVPLSPRNFGKD